MFALSLMAAAPGCAQEDERAPSLGAYDPCRSDKVLSLEAADAADLVQAQGGKPSLVLVYSTGCSISRAFFLSFLELRDQNVARGVTALAFATDSCAAKVEDFVTARDPDMQMLRLIPWQPGELTAAFQTLGIDVASGWTQPLVAVIGKDSISLGQWEAASEQDRPAIEATLAKAWGQ